MHRTRKNRNRFARVGLLAIGLLVTLGVMGVGYSAWTDTIDIHGAVETGYVEVVLSEGQGYPSGNVTASIDEHTINIAVTAGGEGTYECRNFNICNFGTIPVAIQNIEISCSPGLVAGVSGVGVGTQIEQSGTGSDTVYGTVIMTASEAGTYNCTVTFTFVQWNLYEE